VLTSHNSIFLNTLEEWRQVVLISLSLKHQTS
jgi:hypothetical protein